MEKTFAELLIRRWVCQHLSGANIQLEFTDKNSAVITDCEGTRGLLIFENGEVRLESVW